MILLSLVIENHLAELERLHGADLLPTHGKLSVPWRAAGGRAAI
jgi:hypothetical protein